MKGLLLSAVFLLIVPGIPSMSSEETPFALTYNGGRIMTEPVTVSLLWFGTGFHESGMKAIRNAITSLSSSRYPSGDSEVPTLGDWWEVVRQYRDSKNTQATGTIDVGSEWFYTGPQNDVSLHQVVGVSQSAFNNIDRFNKNLTCNRAFEVNESGIYMILFSQEVHFSKDDILLSALCSGNIQIEALAGVNVSMAWARAPRGADDQCSMFLGRRSYIGPPNGDGRIDALVGFVLGKIAEGVINPDGSGWSGNVGSNLTISSYCDYVVFLQLDYLPLFRDTQSNCFNAIGLNGYRYIVQYVWDQQIKNCALKLSKTCGTNPVVLKLPKGQVTEGFAVNHSNGLQPYAPNQRCEWSINYPEAKFISFTVNYLSLDPDSDGSILIFNSKSSTKIQGNGQGLERSFQVMGSKASIVFTSGGLVSFEAKGWELTYSAGLCNGKEDIYNHHGTIGYTPPSGLSYVEGLDCQWILHGKPGTLVSINFTHINISRNLDFLAIYDGKTHQVANFSGYYAGSDLLQLNLTGRVRIAFVTQTDEGDGWSANFHVASPVVRSRKVLLVVLAAFSAVVSVGISLTSIALALNKRKKKYKNVVADEGLMLLRLETFREENQIGEGPSAIVYRAELTDGKLVALKLRKEATSQTQLEEEILLKSSSHSNIISLVGYIQDGLQRRYLVFEYMCGGNLSMNLRQRGESLDWEKRLNIALQVCSAVQRLHMYVTRPLYHGNIASENILLDESCNAKLCGFGSANYCSNNKRNPENLSEMFEDIWGFGIVLVELLRGEHLEDRHSCKNFKSFDEINEFVGDQECLDPRLDVPREQFKIMALAKLGDIAKWCIGCSRSVGGSQCNPKIDDLLSSLKQVKQMYYGD